MKLKFLAAVGLAATLYSCDDTTTGVGEFVADADEITASAQTFEATTKTLKYTDLNQNGVFSRTSSAYLGKFTDPDFGTYTTDFITQINCTVNCRKCCNERNTLNIYYRLHKNFSELNTHLLQSACYTI